MGATSNKVSIHLKSYLGITKEKWGENWEEKQGAYAKGTQNSRKFTGLKV